MLEGLLADGLARLLRQYVRGIDRDGVKIGVWRGELELRDLELLPEALALFLESASIRIPVNVRYGRVKVLKITVPWKTLRRELFRIELHGVTIIAGANSQAEDEETRRQREAKLKRSILTTDDAIRTARWTASGEDGGERRKLENQSTKGMWEPPQWVMKILDSVKVEVTDVNLRFAHAFEGSDDSFLATFQAKRLRLSKTDVHGNEILTAAEQGASSSGSVVHKILLLEEIAVGWEPISANDFADENNFEKLHNPIHRFLLHPLSSSLRATWNRSAEPGTPQIRLTLNLNEVDISLDEFQYNTALKLALWFLQVHKPVVATARERWMWILEKTRPGFAEKRKSMRKLTKKGIQESKKIFSEYVNLRKSLVRSRLNSQEESKANQRRLESLEDSLALQDILSYRDYVDSFVVEELRQRQERGETLPKTPLWNFFTRIRNPLDRDDSGGEGTAGQKEVKEIGISKAKRSDSLSLLKHSSSIIIPKRDMSREMSQGISRGSSYPERIHPNSMPAIPTKPIAQNSDIANSEGSNQTDLKTLDVGLLTSESSSAQFDEPDNGSGAYEPVLLKLSFHLTSLKVRLQNGGFQFSDPPKPLSELQFNKLKLKLEVKPPSGFRFDVILGAVELLDGQTKALIISSRKFTEGAKPLPEQISENTSVKDDNAKIREDLYLDSEVVPGLTASTYLSPPSGPEEDANSGIDSTESDDVGDVIGAIKEVDPAKEHWGTRTFSLDSEGLSTSYRIKPETGGGQMAKYVAAMRLEFHPGIEPLCAPKKELQLSVGGLESVFDGPYGCLMNSVRFWNPQADAKPLLLLIQSATSARLQIIRAALKQYSTEDTHLRLKVDVRVPRIIIPTKEPYREEPCIVVDLGTFSISSNPTAESARYSSYLIQLHNLQCFWVSHLGEMQRHQRILEPTSLQITVGRLQDDPLTRDGRTSVSIDGDIGSVALNFSEDTCRSGLLLAHLWRDVLRDGMQQMFSLLPEAHTFARGNMSSLPTNLRARVSMKRLSLGVKKGMSGYILTVSAEGFSGLLQQRSENLLDIACTVEDASVSSGISSGASTYRRLIWISRPNSGNAAVKFLYSKTDHGIPEILVDVKMVQLAMAKETVTSLRDFILDVRGSGTEIDDIWEALAFQRLMAPMARSTPWKMPKLNPFALKVNVSWIMAQLLDSGLATSRIEALNAACSAVVGDKLSASFGLERMELLDLTVPVEEFRQAVLFTPSEHKSVFTLESDWSQHKLFGKPDNLNAVYLHSFANGQISLLREIFRETLPLQNILARWFGKTGALSQGQMVSAFMDNLSVIIDFRHIDLVLPRRSGIGHEAIRLLVDTTRITNPFCSDYHLNLAAVAAIELFSQFSVEAPLTAVAPGRPPSPRSPFHVNSAMKACLKVIRRGGAVETNEKKSAWFLGFESEENVHVRLSEAEYTTMYFVLAENFRDSRSAVVASHLPSTRNDGTKPFHKYSGQALFEFVLKLPNVYTIIVAGEDSSRSDKEVLSFAARDVCFSLQWCLNPRGLRMEVDVQLMSIVDRETNELIISPREGVAEAGRLHVAYAKRSLGASEIAISLPNTNVAVAPLFLQRAAVLTHPGRPYLATTPPYQLAMFRGRLLLCSMPSLRLFVSGADRQSRRKLEVRVDLMLNGDWERVTKDLKIALMLKQLQAGFVPERDSPILFPCEISVGLSLPCSGDITCSVNSESIFTQLPDEMVSPFQEVFNFGSSSGPALPLKARHFLLWLDGQASEVPAEFLKDISLTVKIGKARFLFLTTNKESRRVPRVELSADDVIIEGGLPWIANLRSSIALRVFDERSGQWLQVVDPWLFTLASTLGRRRALAISFFSDSRLDVTVTGAALCALRDAVESLKSLRIASESSVELPAVLDDTMMGTRQQLGFVVRNETGRSFVVSTPSADVSEWSKAMLEPSHQVEVEISDSLMLFSGLTLRMDDDITTQALGCIFKLPGFESVFLSVDRVCNIVVQMTRSEDPKQQSRVAAQDPSQAYFLWEVSVRNGLHVGTLRSMLRLYNKTGIPLEVSFQGEGGQGSRYFVAEAACFDAPYPDFLYPIKIRPRQFERRNEQYNWSEEQVDFASLLQAANTIGSTVKQTRNEILQSFGPLLMKNSNESVHGFTCKPASNNQRSIRILAIPRLLSVQAEGQPGSDSLAPLEVDLQAPQTIQNLLPTAIGFRLTERHQQTSEASELIRGFLRPLEVAYVRMDKVDMNKYSLALCEIDPVILLDEELSVFGPSSRLSERKGVVTYPCLFKRGRSSIERQLSSLNSKKDEKIVGVRWEQSRGVAGASLLLYADFWVRNRSNANLRVRSISLGDKHHSVLRARPPGTKADNPEFFLGDYISMQQVAIDNSRASAMWTNPIELKEVTGSRTVRLPSASLTMEVRPAEGRFHRTCVVTLRNEVWLENRTSQSFSWWISGSDTYGVISDGERIPLAWKRKQDSNPRIRVSHQGPEWDWSRPIPLRDSGTSIASIYNLREQQQHLLRLVSQDLKGGSKLLVLSNEDRDNPPYKICNKCVTRSIAFWEGDSDRTSVPWLVQPGRSTGYYWNNPNTSRRNRLLRIEIIDLKRSNAGARQTFDVNIDRVGYEGVAGAELVLSISVEKVTKVVVFSDVAEGYESVEGNYINESARLSPKTLLPTRRRALRPRSTDEDLNYTGTENAKSSTTMSPEVLAASPTSTEVAQGIDPVSRMVRTGSWSVSLIEGARISAQKEKEMSKSFAGKMELQEAVNGSVRSMKRSKSFQGSGPRPGSVDNRESLIGESPTSFVAFASMFSEFSFDMDLPWIGLSIVDDGPSELLYVSTSKVQMKHSLSFVERRRMTIFEIGNVQIDNQRPQPRWPVMLSVTAKRRPAGRTEQGARLEPRVTLPSPAVHLLVKQPFLDAGKDVLLIDKLHLEMRDLTIAVDQEIIAGLAQWGRQITEDNHAVDKDEPIDHDHETFEVSTPDVAQMRVYCGEISVSGMDITLSFSAAGTSGVGESDESHRRWSSRILERTLLATIGNVERADILLQQLKLDHVFDPVSSTMGTISRFYLGQLKRQRIQLVVANQLLGNPNSLMDSIARGTRDFVVEPFRGRNGFLQGVRQGTSSLISNTFGALFSSIGVIPRVVASGLDEAISDRQFAAERLAILGRFGVASSPVEGLYRGVVSAAHGVASGVSSLVTYPIQGAVEEGAVGFGRGCYRGVIGLLLKPTMGALDLIAEPAGGFYHVFGNQEDIQQPFRPPRAFSSFARIPPYSLREALGNEILQALTPGDCRGEVLVDWVFLSNAENETEDLQEIWEMVRRITRSPRRPLPVTFALWNASKSRVVLITSKRFLLVTIGGNVLLECPISSIIDIRLGLGSEDTLLIGIEDRAEPNSHPSQISTLRWPRIECQSRRSCSKLSDALKAALAHPSTGVTVREANMDTRETKRGTEMSEVKVISRRKHEDDFEDNLEEIQEKTESSSVEEESIPNSVEMGTFLMSDRLRTPEKAANKTSN